MADWGLLVTSDISTLYGNVWQTGVSWLHLTYPHCMAILGVSWLHLPSPTISTLYGIVWQTGVSWLHLQSLHCMELYGKLVVSWLHLTSPHCMAIWGVSWLHLPSPTISTLYGIVFQTGGSLGCICHLHIVLNCMVNWGLMVTSAISNNLHIV